ncbi:hypothetical protein P170DRAFT_471102 [Aspergillus steynii IBT 23096]|uniref:Stc1 domain-containing protein n=1 Tax=Aspergillus steynii IBT 23096 TaxID=1392250 RepID=A0A2I2GS39_9EURO|nr:uncharacterized protein P170DRAFT_471102 [Aspergillus steynii IBT 23096]PLB55695.1 hypothetical protein P170DRAFT_471102 [Aspergillus steynii IBT 23096]
MAGRYTVKSAYAGGYSETVKRQLERVVMPEKVKCEVCKKFRLQSFYSKRQLENLRNAIVIQGTRAAHGAHAKCRDCVGTPNFELHCCICDQTKGLEDFAKNQRQNRDAARCLDCVQTHTDVEPVLEENKHLLGIEGSAASVSTSQVGDEMYADTTRKSFDRDEDVDDDASSIGGGVWLETGNNAKAMSGGKITGDRGNASGSQGNLHRRTAAPSEASQSVHGGWGSWGVTLSSQAAFSSNNNYAAQTTSRSRFAKIPAARPERSEISTMREREPAPPTVESDNEDDNGPEDFM